MLNNISIRAKITGAFLLVLAVTIALGAFAAQRMGAVNEAAIDVRDNWMPSIVAVSKLNLAVKEYRLGVARHVISTDNSEMASVEADLQAAWSRVEKLRAEYEPLVTPGEERHLIESFDANWKRYLEINKLVLQASRNHEDKNAEELFNAKSHEIYYAAGKSLDDDVELNLREGRKAADVGAAVYASARMWIFAALGLAATLCVAIAWSIIKAVSRPIAALTEVMRRLAARDKTVAILGADRKDEIGAMAAAVAVFKDSMIETDRLTAEQDAARAARSRRQDAMDGHTQSFGQSVTGVMTALGRAANNVRQAADVMTEATAAVHHEASQTADGAGKSSADLTAVAAAVEQFTASVGEISRQVAVASDVASQAVQRAQSSQTTIRGLPESTSRIGDVVRLIDSIAGQTNLLALNATIEAARAGDAGKGFAVVAGEVKALAAQTAKATGEISAQIETVRNATEDTVAAMNEIGTIISKMGEVSTAISAAVEEQSVTTREIASSIQGVAGSTAQAAHAMEHVVQVADQAGEASRNILSDSNEIGAEADKLRREVEQFLTAVNNDSGERRRSERIAGNGVAVTLRIPGSAAVNAIINDFSRTGIAVRHNNMVAVGRDVELDLPDAGGPVSGRVVRAADGVLAITFRDEPQMLSRVDRALQALAGMQKAA